MMDQKIVAAQAAAGDVLIKLSSDIDELKGKKPISDPNSSDPSSGTPEFTSEPFYGMRRTRFQGNPRPHQLCTLYLPDRSDRSDRLLTAVTDTS